jgi:hemoglobin
MRSLPIVPPDLDRDTAKAATEGTPAPGGLPLPDLQDADILGVLVAFYATVERDALLAPYFTSVDMPAHLPRIADFWSTMLFHTGRYSGNAFRPHLEMPGLTPQHFDRWLATLERTVDAMHAGPNAALMKNLAHRVAYSMQLRLGLTPNEPFLPLA